MAAPAVVRLGGPTVVQPPPMAPEMAAEQAAQDPDPHVSTTGESPASVIIAVIPAVVLVALVGAGIIVLRVRRRPLA